MRFYTTEKLGEKQELTPEGFLLCKDVPIARTGIMVYGPGETPIDNGKDLVRIHRDPEEVFRPETIASFVGKPVVNEHPDDDVTPETWKKLAMGVVLNPRQGGEGKTDLMFADLLITDADAIELVRDGKREISCGYDAEYEELGQGEGRQVNIIGNHVALVEKGRCGPRCAIGDQAYKGAKLMSKKSVTGRALDRLRRAFKDGDENEFEEALKSTVAPKSAPYESGDAEEESGGDQSGQHIHIHLPTGKGATENEKAMDKEEEDEKVEDDGEELPGYFKKHVEQNNARFDRLEKLIEKLGGKAEDDESEEMEDDAEAMKEDEPKSDQKGQKEVEGELEAEAPPGTEDRAKKAKDSAYLEDSFQDTLALAEILAPGLRFPTFDGKAKPVNTLSQICKIRRKALDQAYAHEPSRRLIEQVHGRRTFDTSCMSCGAIRTLFKGVAALKKAANNYQAGGGSSRVSDHAAAGGNHPPRTPAEINAANAAFWAKQNG